jgi:membrane protease subunit HflC
MNRGAFLVIGILAIVMGLAVSSAAFTVRQSDQAIVLQFGSPKRVVTEPGLHLKLPFIQKVTFYEKRVLGLKPPREIVVLADQKRLLVDAFARYRIVDPLLFFRTVRTEAHVRQRLGRIVIATLRGVLGNKTLVSLLSAERAQIMRQVRESANSEAGRFGIELVDLRIGRTHFPKPVNQAIYRRMKSKRSACEWLQMQPGSL